MHFMSAEETERIKQQLNDLKAEMPEIEGIAVLTKEGLPIASIFSTIDPAILSAITATLNNVSEKAMEELQKGLLETVIVQGEQGHLVVQEIGTSAVIAVLASKSAKPGLLYILVNRVSDKLADFLHFNTKL
ncbi:MAG: roadblock/LC7 domain-containing protein [Candidatus Heimdallarchaeota archaeon]